MRNYTLLLLVVFASLGSSHAQLRGFRNPLFAPIHFNPGFAGSLDQARISLAYRNNSPGRYPDSHLFYASYDQLSNRLKGAIAGEVCYDREYETSFIRVSGAYAPKVKLGSNWTFSPSLKLGLHQLHQGWTNWDSLLIPGLVPNGVHSQGMNFGAGLLLNSPSFYLGISSDYLAALTVREIAGGPWESDFGVLRTFYAQTGYCLQPRNSTRWSLCATGLLKMRKESAEMFLQTTYNRGWLIVGGGFSEVLYDPSRNSKLVSGIAGFKHSKFRIMGMFSHDLIEEPWGSPRESFDVSFMWYLNRKKESEGAESAGG